MTKPIVTASDIDSATTKGLQALYQRLTGNATSNRNAKALRARLHGMIDAKLATVPADGSPAPGKKIPPAPFEIDPDAGLVALARGSLEVQSKLADLLKDAGVIKGSVISPFSGETVPRKGEKVAKAERKAKVQKVMAKTAPTPAPAKAPNKPTAKTKIATPASAKKPTRAEKVFAGELPAASAKPAKKERADKGVNRKPARAPCPANPDRQHTKETLSDLPAGLILFHNFRSGHVVKVKVIEAPDIKGKGGRFEYLEGPNLRKSRVYDGIAGMRKFVQEVSGHSWNVLMYFRREDTGELLMPYPKHVKPAVIDTK